MGLINLFKTIYGYIIIIIAQWCGFSPFHLNLMSQPMGRIIVDSYSPYKQVIICVVSFPRHLNISVQKERYHTLNWVFQFSMEGEGMKRMALILIAMMIGVLVFGANFGDCAFGIQLNPCTLPQCIAECKKALQQKFLSATQCNRLPGKVLHLPGLSTQRKEQ